jgi:hypothetical protein
MYKFTEFGLGEKRKEKSGSANRWYDTSCGIFYQAVMDRDA